MNELDIIREQLRGERNRVIEVAVACAAADATPPLLEVAIDYLVFVLTRFEERDQLLAEQYRARLTAGTPLRREMDEAVCRQGTSHEAIQKLETEFGCKADVAAEGARSGWSRFGQFLEGPWRERRDAIDAFLQRNGSVTDWRAISLVDADSILEERALHARVEPHLPGAKPRVPEAP